MKSKMWKSLIQSFHEHWSTVTLLIVVMNHEWKMEMMNEAHQI